MSMAGIGSSELIVKVFQLVQAFVIYPVLYRFLGADKTGDYSYVLTLLAGVQVFAYLGIPSAVCTLLSNSQSSRLRKKIIGAGLLIIAGLATTLVPLTIFLLYHWTPIGNYEISIWVLYGYLFLVPLSEAMMEFLRAQLQFRWFYLLQGARVVAVSLGVLLILQQPKEYTVLLLLLLQALVSLAICVVSLNNIRYSVVPLMKKAVLKLTIFVGITKLFEAGAFFVVDLSDRLVIENYYGGSELGLYHFAYVLATMVTTQLFFSVFGSVSALKYNAISSNDEARREQMEWYQVLLITLIVLPVLLSLGLLGAPFVSWYGGSEFVGSFQYILYIGLGQVLLFFSYAFGGDVFVRNPGRRVWLVAIWLFVAAVNLSLNLYFVPRAGVIAAAISTSVSFAMVLVLVVWLRYHFQREFGLVRDALVLCGLAVGIWLAAGYLVTMTSILEAAVFAMLCYLVFLAAGIAVSGRLRRQLSQWAGAYLGER